MPLLEVDDLQVFYGDFQALFGVGIKVAEGETVSIIGANGAGKSTFLRAITGINREKKGRIVFEAPTSPTSALTTSHGVASRSCRRGAVCFRR